MVGTKAMDLPALRAARTAARRPAMVVSVFMGDSVAAGAGPRDGTYSKQCSGAG